MPTIPNIKKAPQNSAPDNDLSQAERDRIVVDNLKLVYKIAKKYYGSSPHYEDIKQEGVLGLITAAKKFDPTLGFKFSTYATWWIRSAMARSKHKSTTIEIPEYLHYGKGSTLTKELAYFTTKFVYLDSDNFGALGYTYHDTITDPESPNPERCAMEVYDFERVLSLIEKLPERKRAVIVGCYLSEKTLKEIGEPFNLTRERVRQIRNDILGDLQLSLKQPLCIPERSKMEKNKKEVEEKIIEALPEALEGGSGIRYFTASGLLLAQKDDGDLFYLENETELVWKPIPKLPL